ncbi:MAG: hypothetical protein ACJ795_04445 [Ktedonobacteraceae bacterium]
MSSEAAWEVGLPHQSRPERSAAHIPMAQPRGFTRRFDKRAIDLRFIKQRLIIEPQHRENGCMSML